MSSLLQHDLDDDNQRHLQIESVLEGIDDDEVGSVVSQSDDDEDSSNGIKETTAGASSNSPHVIFKMLISDSISGAIIGKAGKTISVMQSQSSAIIKVSQSADFYPGTTDRTVLLIGPLNAVLQAQELLWEKVSQFSQWRGGVSHRTQQQHDDTPNPNNVFGKILIPMDAGGLIIGRGGATIKAIQEESRARVQINPKEEMDSKISRERVLTISGSLQACSKCTELIIMKLQEDASIGYQNKTPSYGRSFLGAHLRPEVPHPRLVPSYQGDETITATSVITLTVPDSIVGYVLGKRGSVIAEIQQLSGAKVVVSPRSPRDSEEQEHEAPAPATMRTVTITGSPNATQMAQYLITQKLQLAKVGADSKAADRHRK